MSSEIATCPKCDRSLRVPAELLGQRVKCPACTTIFTAGGEAGGEKAPPALDSGRRRDEWDEEDRPRRPPDRDEEDRPRRAWSRDEDEDDRFRRRSRRRDEDDDDYPRERRRRPGGGDFGHRPGKVQAIAIMALCGGIWTALWVLGVLAGSGCVALVWPGVYYAIVAGILAIVKGAQLLGQNADHSTVPRTVGVLLIINIVNCDVVSLVLGILIVTFCSDPEVTNFFRGR
jgi:hypothetical protein